MSAHLLAAALNRDVDDRRTECEAINSEEGAISHNACDGMNPTSQVTKKRKSAKLDVDKSAKVAKVDSADGPVQCIFVEGECIPLWPQYNDSSSTDKFIRVSSQESWVKGFMVVSRKNSIIGDERQEHGKKKKYARGLAVNVCNGLLQEFRRVLGEAKTRHKKSCRACIPIDRIAPLPARSHARPAGRTYGRTPGPPRPPARPPVRPQGSRQGHARFASP